MSTESLFAIGLRGCHVRVLDVCDVRGVFVCLFVCLFVCVCVCVCVCALSLIHI